MEQIKQYTKVKLIQKMSIFPQTFSKDKPIYYPQTWQLGKTAQQLYEQWKLTSQYWIVSNIFQCVLAGLWMWFISVLTSAIYEIWKLYRLDEDNIKKLANRKFIEKNFVTSVGFICFVAFFITGSLLVYDETARYSLLKGYFTYIGVKWAIMIITKCKELYQIWKQYSNKQFDEEKESVQERKNYQ